MWHGDHPCLNIINMNESTFRITDDGYYFGNNRLMNSGVPHLIGFIKCCKITHLIFQVNAHFPLQKTVRHGQPDEVYELIEYIMKAMTKGKVEIYNCNDVIRDFIMKYTNSTIDTIVCHHQHPPHRIQIKEFCLEKNIKFTDT